MAELKSADLPSAMYGEAIEHRIESIGSCRPVD